MKLPWSKKAPAPKAPEQNLPPVLAGLRSVWRFLRYLYKRPIRTYLAATVATGALTTALPQTVSQTLDGHMAGQGLPALSQHFSTVNMRVYDRGNILQVPHATFLVASASGEDFSSRPISTTIGLVTFNFGSLLRQLLPGALDAYSLGTPDSHTERQCVIRPPRRISLDEVINKFTGFERNTTYRFNTDKDVMSDIFYVYVMAHEARHCDQAENRFNVLLHETDADTYAMRTVRHIYGDSAEVTALLPLLAELRVVSAVIHGDNAHATDRAMARGNHTVMDAVEDQIHYARLSAVLSEIARKNRQVFKESEKDYPSSARYYYAAQALISSRNIEDAQLKQAARDFVRAMDKLAARTDATVITTLPESARQRLSTDFLTAPYRPAPERLPAPPTTRAA